jgi:hypothetical protein
MSTLTQRLLPALLVMLVPGALAAQTDLTTFAEAPEEPDATAIEAASASEGAEEGGLPDWWAGSGGYRGWLRSELERLGDYDLYGVSAQLPAGYLKLKWDYGWLTANARFDRYGNRGPIINPLTFDVNDATQIDVALDVSGSGNGHTFQSSYGITDPLDWYIEVPFTSMNLNLNPRVRTIDEDGNYIGSAAAAFLGVSDRTAYNEEAFLYDTLPALGRPAPAVGYDGRMLLGDINTGFSWNFFRNSRFSSSYTGRVYLPTGHIPSPESSLTYATGPQPDIGVGGWGVSSTSGYDLRLYKHSYWIDIILSHELGFGYFFKQSRPYPTNFTEPDPDAAELDPGLAADLSNLEGDFDYTPGFNLTWAAQLNISAAIFGLGVAYGWQYSQEPVIEGDEAFISMVESMELLGASAINEVQLGASINLLPLYIPASVGITRRIVVGGRDTIAWSNFWQVSVEAFVPMYLLWDRDRGREE